METLEQLIDLLRLVIIPLGTTFRVIFCFVKMIYDEDASNSYKKKIWNAIAFLIMSELILLISDLLKHYYIPVLNNSAGGGGSGGGR